MKELSKALFHFKKALSHPNLPNAEKIREVVLSIEAGQKQKRRERGWGLLRK